MKFDWLKSKSIFPKRLLVVCLLHLKAHNTVSKVVEPEELARCPPGSWNHCKNRCIEFGRSKFECCHKSFRGGGWTALEGQRALHVRGHARKIVKLKTLFEVGETDIRQPLTHHWKTLARRHLIKCLIKKYCKNSNKQNLHKRARWININGWFTWSPDEVTSLSRVESFKITPGNQY